MKFFKTSIIVLSLSALVACSSKDTAPKIDYKTPGVKKQSNTLEVPPDLTGINSQNRFEIPSGSGAVRATDLENKNTQQTLNNSGTVLIQNENIHIEREGSQRWLVINNKRPQEIWPLLKTFWQEMGFIIDKEEPAIGYLETQWAENRAAIPQDPIRRLFEKVGIGSIYSSSLRDKFIIRLERGKNNTSNVTFSHRGAEEVFVGKGKETTTWQMRPSDPNLEAQLLGRFMLRIGADEATVQKQLDQAASSNLAELKDNRLELSGHYDRNSHRLRLALERIGMSITQEDAASGHYYIQQSNIESDAVSNKKPGFFSRVFGSSDKPKAKTEKSTHLIKITQQGTKSIVSVTQQDGSPLSANAQQYVLKRLYQELR